MKILITGGGGFIGSHIADKYIDLNHEVAVIDNLSTGVRENINPGVKFYLGDISNPEFVNKVMAEFQPQILNHHAAHIHVGKSVDDPKFDATINILGTINLMQSLVRMGNCRKVIFASTGGAMYGNNQTPFNEEMMPSPLSPYGVSKRSAELYLGFYHSQYGIPFVALRYANVYGPRQNPVGEAGVVSIFSKKILEKKQPVINGDGLQTRDYVFVEDVAAANVLALNTPEAGVFNIGTSIETDVNSIFELANKNFGADWKQVHGPARAGEQTTSSLSYQKAKQVLNWQPKVKLAEGIKKTVEWFRSHPERV